LDLPYGPSDRHRFDLFLPEAAPKGLLVFIHGGYWLAFGRESWSHFAQGALARGWACAMPSYTLAPAARISAITAEIDSAITAACAEIAGPVVVTGHSAGGHLSARMGCTDRKDAVADRVRRVVPISPVADLEPLLHTDMNADLRLTEAEVATESPAHLGLRDTCHAHIWVGGQERPAFLWQARTLSENWKCAWTVDPGKHHFNVIDGLKDPSSALIEACLTGI
jgi:acetyl esterase/lipase